MFAYQMEADLLAVVDRGVILSIEGRRRNISRDVDGAIIGVRWLPSLFSH
jgi:hypothetical protein